MGTSAVTPKPASSIIPGVHHPEFEDENPNFWKDILGSNENPSYLNPDPPAFIKKGVDLKKVSEPETEPKTLQESQSIAAVSNDDPYKVEVYKPEFYGTGVRAHELTHTYQFTRNPDLNVSKNPPSGEPINYDYGWVPGLEKAQKEGKTVSDFNQEQQADMVEDYKRIHDMYLDKAKKGMVTPEDERAMYRAQKAYHPFVKQLASMPAKDVPVSSNPLLQLLGYKKPPTIDLKSPEPPGLPSYDTPGLGVLPADPLIGGRSQETPVPKNLSSSLMKQKDKKDKKSQ